MIRTRDEAPRLRLALASLRGQPLHEIIVVDDCSSDATADVVAEAARDAPIRYLHNTRNVGRSAASNIGAHAASGDVLLFLDGDNLARPDCVARHRESHAQENNIAGRGELMHLRCTRFLLDPQTASPRPGEEERLARLPPAEREQLQVTREQVAGDFASIERRAQFGVYPGAVPRRVQELELDALRAAPDCPVLWAAAAGSNFSVRRNAFNEVGGFDERLDINEHRELALRLAGLGHCVRLVPGALSYHLTHRSGWRDPLHDTQWERVFHDRHPGERAIRLLAVFWAGLADPRRVPEPLRIESLPQLAHRAQTLSDDEVDALRSHVGLEAL